MYINSLMFTTNLWQRSCLRELRMAIKYLTLFSYGNKSKTLFDNGYLLKI